MQSLLRRFAHAGRVSHAGKSEISNTDCVLLTWYMSSNKVHILRVFVCTLVTTLSYLFQDGVMAEVNGKCRL